MITDAGEWANEMFKDRNLGAPRRTRRLVQLATNYAKNIGSNTVECCGGDESEVEASYRFLRNDEVKPEAVREGGFNSIARIASNEKTLLAIEDTTTLRDPSNFNLKNHDNILVFMIKRSSLHFNI